MRLFILLKKISKAGRSRWQNCCKTSVRLRLSRAASSLQSAFSFPSVSLQSAFSRPSVGLQSAFSQPSVSLQSAFSQPSVSLQSAFSQPSVGLQSAFSRLTRQRAGSLLLTWFLFQYKYNLLSGSAALVEKMSVGLISSSQIRFYVSNFNINCMPQALLGRSCFVTYYSYANCRQCRPCIPPFLPARRRSHNPT